MALSTTITYDTPLDFTYDLSLIDVIASADLSDQRPANAIAAATYTAATDLSWADFSPLTGTLNGSPTITGNKLVCAGTQGVRYTDALIGSSLDTGAIKCKITPNYTTSPPANINVFGIFPPSGSLNRIALTHSPTGNTLRLTVTDSAGTDVYLAIAIGPAWTPTAGVEYEFELNWDSVAGVVRLFIDGALHGTLSPGAWTRGTTATRFSIGASPNIYDRAEYSYADAVLFDVVQHTTAYTAGYTLPESVYVTTNPTISTNSTFLTDQLLSFSEVVTASGGDNIQYIIIAAGVDKYWDGAAWSNSDGTYAQSNTASDINTNVSTLDVSSGQNISVKAFLHSATGATTPSLTSVTITYSFYAPAPSPINECEVYCNLEDILQDVADFTTINATFYAQNKAAFAHTTNDTVIFPFTYSTPFDSTGYADLSVIETASVEGATIDFYIEYTLSSGATKRVAFEPVQVPDQSTVNIVSIANIRVP